MQRIENLVDLEKCCKMSIWSQKSASIQKRKSVLKFDDLAKESEKDSISNFRTEVLSGEQPTRSRRFRCFTARSRHLAAESRD